MEQVLPASAYNEISYTGSDSLIKAVYEAVGSGYVVEVTPSGFGGHHRYGGGCQRGRDRHGGFHHLHV